MTTYVNDNESGALAHLYLTDSGSDFVLIDPCLFTEDTSLNRSQMAIYQRKG